MSKLYGLVIRWLFVSINGILMQFVCVVGFKSSTLTGYCKSSWFIHQQRKKYSSLCVLCWHNYLSWFQGSKYKRGWNIHIHPLFGLESQILTLSQKFPKSDFLGHCSFTQPFQDVEKLSKKSKIFVKFIQRFWYV